MCSSTLFSQNLNVHRSYPWCGDWADLAYDITSPNRYESSLRYDRYMYAYLYRLPRC